MFYSFIQSHCLCLYPNTENHGSIKEDCFKIYIPNQHVGLLYKNGPFPEVGLHLQQ